MLVITGAGDKAFVSGADVSAIRERRRDDALFGINSRLMAAVEAHEAVTIAAVNGYALGGAASWRSRATCAWPRTPCSDCPSPRWESSSARAVRSACRVSWGWDGQGDDLTGARWEARRALEVGLVSEVVPLADSLAPLVPGRTASWHSDPWPCAWPRWR